MRDVAWAGDGSAKPVLVPALVPTQYALAGPSHLTTKWKTGETLNGIVGIVTFGSVIPEGMLGGEAYVLMRTSRGSRPP